MKLKWKMPENRILRSMIAVLTGVKQFDRTPGNFTPYFRYTIGKPELDFQLYFSKEPFAERYYNEFFNRISGLTGSEIYKFIGFHYDAYPDGNDFIRFLRYEISDRLRCQLPPVYHRKLLTASEWVTEQQAALDQPTQPNMLPDLEKTIRNIWKEHQPALAPQPELLVKELSEKLNAYLEKLIAETEEKLIHAAGRLPSGNITLNNRNHEEKLAQFFLLLKEVKAPDQLGKSEQLFKGFADIDIATILHLHVENFRDKKIPTLQKTIGQLNARIRPNHPKVSRLVEAMRDFFY